MKSNNSGVQRGLKLVMMLTIMLSWALLDRSYVEAAAFDSGEGTVGAPYVIKTAVQLNEIRHNLNKHFVLGADIDMSVSIYSAGWTPIGTFSGSLKGQGHTISGLTIIGNSTNTGLFSTLTSQGVIKDLNLMDSNVSNPSYSITGGVVARNEGMISNVKVINSTIVGGAFTASIAGSNTGTITDSQVIGGSVNGGQTVGGLMGQNSGVFENSRVVDTFVTGASDAGGVVGSNQGAGVINRVSYVSSLDSLSSGAGLGGLVGSNHGTITHSYSESLVGKTANGTTVGGLVSYNNGIIEDSYAKGTVRGTASLGGVVGSLTNTGRLTRTYASGTVSAGTGGLIGQAQGEVNSSFWNTTTAGNTAYNSGTVTGSGATGLSAAEIMKKANFEGAGWNFTHTWDITEDVGTPTLTKYLENLEVEIGGSPISIYFFPNQYQYIINTPSGTELAQVTATKANVTDTVYVDSGAANVSVSTITLQGAQTVIPINVYRGDQQVTYTITILDTTAPDAPVFTLSTTEPAHEVTVTIEYSADTVDRRYQLWGDNASTYTGPFVLTSNRTITAYATDAAGNMSQTVLEIKNIDLTAPGGTLIINEGANVTHTDEVTLKLDDGDTGAAYMRFSDDNSSWSEWEDYNEMRLYTLPPGDGGKTIYARLKDAAGNESVIISASIILDTQVPPPLNQAPTITSNGGMPTVSVHIEENTTAVTTVTANDPDGDAVTYSITGGSDQGKFTIEGSSGVLTFNEGPDYEIPGDTDANNSYEVEVTATDNGIGSLTDVQTITVIITDAVPVISLIPYDGTTPTQSDITVSATTNEGTLNASSHIFTDNGSFNFIATDGSGNITTQTVTITNIDKAAPTTTDHIIIDNTTKYVTINLSALDNGPGAVTSYYTVDGKEFKGTVIYLNKQGTRLITYWSIDAVGNMETPISKEVKVNILQMDSNGQFDIADVVHLMEYGTLLQQDMNGDGMLNREDILIMLEAVTPISF
jgi:hypothetical protein